METSNKLIVNLIKEKVLNSNIRIDTANYIANAIIHAMPNSVNAIVEAAISTASPILLEKGDMVLYRQVSQWKCKELGSLDALIDAKLAIKIDKNLDPTVEPGILYLGKVLDSTSYGDFHSYACKYEIETYGLTDDLKRTIDKTDVEYTDIYSTYSGDNL